MASVLKQANKATERVSLPVSMEDTVLLLLRGIQDHSVIADDSGGKEFQAKLAELQRAFKGKDNAHQVAEAAVELLAKRHSAIIETSAQQRSALAKATADLAAAT